MASDPKPHTITILHIQKEGKYIITYKLVNELNTLKWPRPRGLGFEASYTYYFINLRTSKVLHYIQACLCNKQPQMASAKRPWIRSTYTHYFTN
jgi:hypothetical protein